MLINFLNFFIVNNEPKITFNSITNTITEIKLNLQKDLYDNLV